MPVAMHSKLSRTHSANQTHDRHAPADQVSKSIDACPDSSIVFGIFPEIEGDVGIVPNSRGVNSQASFVFDIRLWPPQFTQDLEPRHADIELLNIPPLG